MQKEVVTMHCLWHQEKLLAGRPVGTSKSTSFIDIILNYIEAYLLE